MFTACLFCQYVSTPGNCNQHFRSQVGAVYARSPEHHPLSIIRAFHPDTDLTFSRYSPDHQAVLLEFARHAKRKLHGESNMQAWITRDYRPRTVEWWDKKVSEVLSLYISHGRDKGALRQGVGEVVMESVIFSLEMNVSRNIPMALPAPAPRQAKQRAIAPVNHSWSRYRIPQTILKTGDSVAINSKKIKFDDGSNLKRTELEDGSKGTIGATMKSSCDDHPAHAGKGKRRMGDLIPTSPGVLPSPPQKRKKSMIPVAVTAPRRATNDTYAPWPSKREVKNPGQSVLTSTASHHVATVAPLVTLRVTGMDGKTADLPLWYFTDMDKALEGAVSLLGVQLAFTGADGKVWGGTEWRKIMDQAGDKQETLNVKLVVKG